MSDVYSFGVVLLELITGRRSVDKNRPSREQSLVDWARPMLNDSRKLGRIMDPRLEGQYSESGARKAAALAYQCLSNRPKQRPSMSTVVETLEPLKNYNETPFVPFVYTVPSENNLHEENAKELEGQKELKRDSQKKESRHHHGHRHQHRSPKSPKIHSQTDVRQSCRDHQGMHSPLHHMGSAA